MFDFIKRWFRQMPPKDWLASQIQIADNTPDVSLLEEKGFQLVFLYDECMFGRRMYDIIADHSANLCSAFTANTYRTVLSNQLRTPVVLQGRVHGVKDACVKGEIHAVLSSKLLDLDNYKYNGVLFERMRTRVVVPYRKIIESINGHTTHHLKPQIELVDVWIYIGIPEYWNPLLDGGYDFPPAKLYQPNFQNREWLGNFTYFIDDKPKN